MSDKEKLSISIRVQDYIHKENLLEEGQKVICAVSGGLDSMFMLEVLNILGYKLIVAHFNFGLRGNESDLDEALVEEWAKVHNFPFYRNSVAKEHFDSKSIQEEARILRYIWFESLANELKIKAVALAHHADDQVETIFLQMLRGTGLAGMRGMLPKHGLFIRPLLALKKNELKTCVLDRNIKWREDSSNENTDYKRNKMRHLLLPLLQEISPGYEDVLLRNAEKFKLNEVISNYRYVELYALFTKENTNNFRLFDWLQIQTHEHGKFFLMELLRDKGFNFSALNEIWFSSFSNESRIWKNSESQSLELKGEQLFFWKAEWINFELEISNLGEYQLPNGARFSFLQTTALQQNLDLKSKDEFRLDLDKIQFPCRISNWKTGDEIASFGLKGKKKKVSDLLTERKLSQEAKHRVLKLEDANRQIVCLPGIELSYNFCITKSTKNIASIKFEIEL